MGHRAGGYAGPRGAYSAWRSGGRCEKAEAKRMPWVVRDAIDDINRAVGRRWQGLDRLLPGRADLPEGCAAPVVAAGANGRPAGLAVCRHQSVPADTLTQPWGTASRFSLILRL